MKIEEILQIYLITQLYSAPNSLYFLEILADFVKHSAFFAKGRIYASMSHNIMVHVGLYFHYFPYARSRITKVVVRCLPMLGPFNLWKGGGGGEMSEKLGDWSFSERRRSDLQFFQKCIYN